MAVKASSRLTEIADALPLHPGMRTLEIGCGPGVLARLIAEPLKGDVFVLGIDQSPSAIAAAMAQIAENAYSVSLAFRVGALDGRHPETGRLRFHASAQRLCPEVACSSMAATRRAKFRQVRAKIS
jgi:ribosomal protein L11 methylase PrmA